MGRHAAFAAIGLIVGLLGGIAIGHAIAGEGPPPREIITTGTLPACSGRPLESPGKQDDPGRKKPENDVEPRHEAPGELDSLAAIIAKADIPPIPSGDGEITGHVLTGAGEPVAGVTITALSDYPEDRGFTLPTAEERIEARIRYERWIDEAKSVTTTAADGSYRLAGLAKGTEYGVGARAEGWEISSSDPRRYRHTAGDICNFVAETSISLEVRVFLPDGSPATSGRISCDHSKGSGGSTSHGSLIERGGYTFKLGPGKWSVSAQAGKHEELTAGPTEVTLEAGVKPDPVELHLKASPGIVGTVKCAGTIVGLRPYVQLQANPPTEPPPATVKEDERGGFSGRRDDSFKFVGLTPGRYRVLLVLDGEVKDWEDATVTDVLVEIELELPEPARGDYIILRVYDPAGKPLTDVNLHITYHSGGSSSGSGGSELKQPDGSYWLPKKLVSRGREPEKGVECWYTVRVTSDTYGSREVRYEITDTHELEVRFSAPALVTLTVSNFNDHALRDKLRWSLIREGADGRSTRTTSPREGANSSPLKMGPEEPGEYFLVLTYAEGRSSFDARELLRQPVTLAAGDNALTAAVPVLYTLTLTGENDALRRIEIRAKDGSFNLRSYSITPTDGRMAVECVPAGTYVLKGGDGEMEVTVSSDTTVKFEPRAYNCFVLTIPAGGEIEALGFADGDKLVKVDGEAVSVMNVGEAQVQASLAKENTTWTVLRNGSPTDVTFNGKTLMEIMSRRGPNRERFDMRPGYQD
jgi:hypothetical protein